MKHKTPNTQAAKTNNAANQTETSAKSETAKASPIGETPVSGEDKAKLKQCEDIIRQNENGVFITGRNLSQINSDGLYKAAGHKSFEIYCKERWGMSDKHAYRLIKAATCYDALAKHETKKKWVLPRNEAQIRPLAKIEEKEWVPSWEKVMTKFAEKPFTAEDIDNLLNPVKPETAKVETPPNTTAEAGDTDTEKGEEVPAKKLQLNLKKIEELVSKALESAVADENIPVKDFRKLLEKIKKLIETSK